MTAPVTEPRPIDADDPYVALRPPRRTREFDFLRAFAWVVPLMLAAGSLAFVFTELQPPRYDSHARVVLAAAAAPDGEPYVVVDSVSALANRQFLGTYADIVDSADVANLATAAARIAVTDRGGYEITSAVSPESSAIDIRVTGSDADRTAAVAHHVAEEAGTRFEEFYPIFTVRVLDPPVAPSDPSGPHPVRMALTAALVTAGAWLLAVLAFGTHERA